jgi:hypothetical protein
LVKTGHFYFGLTTVHYLFVELSFCCYNAAVTR